MRSLTSAFLNIQGSTKSLNWFQIKLLVEPKDQVNLQIQGSVTGKWSVSGIARLERKNGTGKKVSNRYRTKHSPFAVIGSKKLREVCLWDPRDLCASSAKEVLNVSNQFCGVDSILAYNSLVGFAAQSAYTRIYIPVHSALLLRVDVWLVLKTPSEPLVGYEHFLALFDHSNYSAAYTVSRNRYDKRVLLAALIFSERRGPISRSTDG